MRSGVCRVVLFIDLGHRREIVHQIPHHEGEIVSMPLGHHPPAVRLLLTIGRGAEFLV